MTASSPPAERGTTGHVLDDVDHARHYNTHPSGIECITISECLPGGLQSAFEYVWRHEHKGNPVQDLDKALWRLLREDATYKAHPIRYVALLRDGICLLVPALARETEEEIGLVVETARILDVIAVRPPVVRKACELVFFLVTAYAGKLKAREPGTSVQWMRLSALAREPSLNTPGTNLFLATLVQNPKGQRLL
jgi:8-oxo-dGTP pyrophosphatase MutT (NUDIX family)